MEHVRRQLREVVARSRPELSAGEQRRFVSQLLELIATYELNAAPIRTVEGHEPRDPSLSGIAFVVACEPNGTVKERVRDNLGFGSRLAAGATLESVVLSFHAQRVAKFIRSVHRKHVSY